MCNKCDDLREEIADLKQALSVYEVKVPKDWSLPGFPDLRLTLNQKHFVRALYESRPRVISARALMDNRPRRHIDSLDGNTAAVVICQIRKVLKGTPFRIDNVLGDGYRLTELLPVQVLSRSTSRAA